jgi:hypothetical protein
MTVVRLGESFSMIDGFAMAEKRQQAAALQKGKQREV